MSKINFPKKQEQRLIPKYLLEYAEELQENHPDPTAEWGGGGGSPIEAGTGIIITGDDTKTISVDTEDVAMVSSLSTVAFSGDYDDLENKPTIPTATSDLYNDSGYITSSDLSNYVDKSTSEDIGGYKTFTNTLKVQDGVNNYDQAELHFDELNFHTSNWITRIQPNANLSMGEVIAELPEQSGTLALQSEIPTDVSDLYNDAGYITGITSSDVTSALGYTPYNASNPAGYITGINSSDVITALGYTPGTSNFSGSYNDLTDKPTIPTVNNSTITLQVNGTTAGSFTTNQSSASTINLSVPSGVDVVTITTSLGVGTGTVTQAQYDILHDNPRAVLELKGYYHADGSWYMRQVYNTILTGDLTYEVTEVSRASTSLPGSVFETRVTIDSNLNWTLDSMGINGVIGTNDGTNWTSLTIDGITKNIPSGSTPSNMVTTNTAQDITGEKTFVGSTRIKFEKSASSDTLGFTCYDESSNEFCNMQAKTRTVGGVSEQYLTLGNYSSSGGDANVGFRINPTDNYSYYYNFLAPHGTNTQFTNTGYSTSSNNYLVASVTDGTTTVKADALGKVNISSLMPTVPTTATSTVTPTTGTFVTGTTTTTTSLVFTYTDNTTETITLVTAVTDSTSSAMTGATVTTTLS